MRSLIRVEFSQLTLDPHCPLFRPRQVTQTPDDDRCLGKWNKAQSDKPLADHFSVSHNHAATAVTAER